MSFADKFAALAPFSVEREIGGQSFKFYQCSLRAGARMAGVISKIAGHVSVLLVGDKQDCGQTIEDFTDDGVTVNKTTIDPINPDLAKLRVEQRAGALSGAISELVSKNNRQAMAELLMDSLRDEFPRKGRTSEDSDMFDDMDIPFYVEFIKGLFAANQKLLGGLGKELGRAAQEKADEVLGQLRVVKETDG